MTQTLRTSVEIPGVYVLPRMLTVAQIEAIIQVKEMTCHHDDGSHGHDDIGHGGFSEEEETTRPRPTTDIPRRRSHPERKDDEKPPKANLHYFRADKPHSLPWAAKLIYQHVPHIAIGDLRPCGVDENMQLYLLQEGAGTVPEHVDEDFEGPNSSLALCSILLYLNDGYTGGQTVFNGTIAAPHVAVGGGLVFRHDILHGGLPVITGQKYILKTDLLFRQR